MKNHLYVALEITDGKFKILATVTELGIKCVSSNVPRKMGNTWEKMGLIRSAL